ncbi:MAG: 30S ribosomal protein S8 [Anaerolineae bacterium]|jgi:small subunit ribosomal protein S8
MTVTDPIADMLARIRNALIVQHSTVEMPSSKMKVAIAGILKDEGYIEDYRVVERANQPGLRLVIDLRYVGERRHRQPVITGMERVSKPGRRMYTKVEDIPWVRSGMGIAILTTPKGVLTGQQARRLGVGGEVVCHIW